MFRATQLPLKKETSNGLPQSIEEELEEILREKTRDEIGEEIFEEGSREEVSSFIEGTEWQNNIHLPLRNPELQKRKRKL